MKRNKCPVCKKIPQPYLVRFKKEEKELIGCCGAFFDGMDKWNKYATDSTYEFGPKESEKTEKKIIIISNPRLSDASNQIVRYWNSKSLRKHKDLNSNVVQEASRSIDALLKGRFYGIDAAVSVKLFLKCIDVFEAMANDPAVFPTNPQKKAILKKNSLADFIYNERAKFSHLKNILDSGMVLRTKTEPFSETVMDKLYHHLKLKSGKELSSANIERATIFLNAVNDFYQENKRKISGSVFNIAKTIVNNISENRQNFPFKMLDSEEMKLNIIRDVAVSEGFMLESKNKDEKVFYSNKRSRSDTTHEF